MNFSVGKPKNLFLRGLGLKKTQTTTNMPKLGHYIAFKQKIPKRILLWENLKIYFLGG
jgi:hypothetical protein